MAFSQEAFFGIAEMNTKYVNFTLQSNKERTIFRLSDRSYLIIAE